MKYLAKNRKTGEETLCEKVGVDGFDYYIVNKLPNAKDYFITRNNGLGQHNGAGIILFKDDKKVIATNNKSLDIPMVIDEVEELAWIIVPPINVMGLDFEREGGRKYFIDGFNKCKETYQFTKENMLEFLEWSNTQYREIEHTQAFKGVKSINELIDIWQQQRTIKIEVE